jgi:hypothetical protein
MPSANGLLTLFDSAIWILCILFGAGLGVLFGRFAGTLLGWMIANSLDSNISKGGQLGRRLGTFFGIVLGSAIGIYSALHLIALVTN